MMGRVRVGVPYMQSFCDSKVIKKLIVEAHYFCDRHKNQLHFCMNSFVK